ncbi:MAG: alpha/beta hydrolase [Kiloniellales bacterium]|nr:alpha/beta hydrolase [Kiloniellales bacterium]
MPAKSPVEREMTARVAIVDRVEAGQGPLVVLVHSSVSGARQWRRLMADLEDRFRLVAVNLFGYGSTPAWSGPNKQTLEDQATLVEAALPDRDGRLCLVGHSFGASVAMRAAAKLGDRVARLVLLEPNPFYLLKRHGRQEAFAEIATLRSRVKKAGAAREWTAAAESFADYWGGAGTWTAMPEARRAAFAEALRPNLHEWDAVMGEATALDDWAEMLPQETLVVSARRTVRPIREIVELLREACPAWRYRELAEGGHMAPLTHPDLINPIVAAFLDGRG